MCKIFIKDFSQNHLLHNSKSNESRAQVSRERNFIGKGLGRMIRDIHAS